MTLVKCNKCKNKYLGQEDNCPFCNKKLVKQKTSKSKIIIAIVLFIVLTVSFFINQFFESRCFYEGCYDAENGVLYCAKHYKEIQEGLDYLNDYVEYLSQPSKSDLKLTDVSLDYSSKYSSYQHASGSLTNYSSKTVKFVKVKVLFKDYSGKIIDTDWTYAVGSEGLAPYETVKWECSVKKDYSISKVSAEIIDFSY